jgi:Lipase (class 3)
LQLIIIQCMHLLTGPFCDGEAHSEMAKMAELLWEATEDLVLNTMAKHPSYELVFVGHSLGAGTASLLNVLYHFKYPKSKYAVRSVVFACPPVFTTTQSESENDNPMSASTSKAFTSCINFIHQNDCVPFLSVDSVRQLFKSIQVIENATLSWIERIKIITKYEKPYQELVQSVQYAQTPEQRVQPIPGAPILRIPAEYNVWLQEQDQQPPPWQQQQPTKQGPESTTALEHQQVQRIFYNSKVCDSQKLATLGLVLDLTMWDDHVPSQYELALSHLQEDDITI